jgi:hypothetical protein
LAYAEGHDAGLRVSLSYVERESRAVAMLAMQKPGLRVRPRQSPRYAEREAPRPQPKSVVSQDQTNLKGDVDVAFPLQPEHPKVVCRNFGLGDGRSNAHRRTWLEDILDDLVESGDPAIARTQQHVDLYCDRSVRH